MSALLAQGRAKQSCNSSTTPPLQGSFVLEDKEEEGGEQSFLDAH